MRVVMLPPIPWLAARQRHQPDAEPDLGALERALAAHGVEVTILDPTGWPWNPLAGRHPLLQGIDPLRALRVLLLHRRADAVVCVFEGPALVPALLRRALRFRPPVLMWDLGLTAGWRLRERIADAAVPRVSAILTLGSNQEAAIARRWPRHAPVRWVGHYIDTAFWRPMPPDGDAGTVLAVGDDAGRDYATLLDAAAMVDAPFVIRSNAKLALDPQRHRQVRQAPRLSYAALRDLYAEAAVVVVPLHDLEQAGGVTAVLEAAAMGRAMVASGSSGVRDWLRDGETCLVAPPGDAPALAAAIQRLLGDPALRRRLGQGARAFAEASCTPDAFAGRLAAALRGRHAEAAAVQGRQ